MIRRLLMLVLLAAPAFADDGPKLLTSNLDVTATSYTYYVYSDERERPVGASIDIVTATNAITSGSTGAFTGMAAGDMLYFQSNGGTFTNRRITTWTNANSIVVNATTTLAAGTNFRWRKRSGGTASTDGWFDVYRHPSGMLYVSLVTFNAASLEVRAECKGAYGTISEVFTKSYTATTVPNEQYPIAEIGRGCQSFRVGSKLTTDGGAQDLSLEFTPGSSR